MHPALKWLIKFCLTAVLWVFLLSIRWDGRTLFSYAHETLVQNAVVQAVDEEIADLWYRLSETARAAFQKNRPDDPEKV